MVVWQYVADGESSTFTGIDVVVAAKRPGSKVSFKSKTNLVELVIFVPILLIFPPIFTQISNTPKTLLYIFCFIYKSAENYMRIFLTFHTTTKINEMLLKSSLLANI